MIFLLVIIRIILIFNACAMLRMYDYNEKEDRLTVTVYRFCPVEPPCLVIRCDSRALRLHIERLESFSLSQTCDEIYKLYAFLENPHWKSSLVTESYHRKKSEMDTLL